MNYGKLLCASLRCVAALGVLAGCDRSNLRLRLQAEPVSQPAVPPAPVVTPEPVPAEPSMPEAELPLVDALTGTLEK